jgi:hypothetical protein
MSVKVEAVKAVVAIIGRHCWSCRFRHKDDWFVLEGFCHYYPSLEEREILKGSSCHYYGKREIKAEKA